MGLDYYFRVSKWFFQGCNNYTKGGFVKNSASFENLNDLKVSGLKVMITGANTGIGFCTANKLIKHENMTLYLLCRNKEKGEKALQFLNENAAEGSVAHLHIVDIGKISDVKSFVEEFKENKYELNVLVNNAGVLMNEYKEVEESKIESSFAVNVLGTKVLTEGLVDIMQKPSCFERPRVITVTSGGGLTELLNYSDPALTKVPFNGTGSYSQQKRQQIVLTEYWANKYNDVTFLSMHPGWVDTDGVKNSLPTFYKYMKNKLRTVQQGCDTIVYLTLHPEVDKFDQNGLFFFDRKPAEKYLTSASKPSADNLNFYIEVLKNLENASSRTD